MKLNGREAGRRVRDAALRGRQGVLAVWSRLGIWQWAAVLVIGIAAGLGSALLAVASGRGEVRSGVWATSLTYGSAEADIYTRARVALFGLLALAREQTVYYTAARDASGELLSGDCTYIVRGRDLDARWWSITAYGPDSHLIPNEAGIYSYSKTSAVREADGSYVIRISAEPQPGNWLPVKRGERFDMTARLYNPAAFVVEAPAAVVLPDIVREGCR
jgi:hypothetical protein